MYLINPVSDPRWPQFVAAHSQACAFHTAGWLQALQNTYGYKPLAITSSEPGAELTEAIPFCRVHSWATGRRLVSLPFTDHCQPLIASENIGAYWEFLTDFARQQRYKSVELRPAADFAGAALDSRFCSAEYWIHWLDLSPSIEDVLKSLDKDSIQRKIRRAERERLEYKEGRSREIIDIFYGLLLRTRRRHQLPPQPRAWFNILAGSLDDAIQFRIALKDGAPAAAIVTLRHPNSMIYKYGCSDERYHATGAMPFLYWRMIQDAKQAGIASVDFGRSDTDNPGLIRFKDQWGTRRAALKYYRFPEPRAAHTGSSGAFTRLAKNIFSRLPDSVLETVGRLVYKHIG